MRWRVPLVAPPRQAGGLKAGLNEGYIFGYRWRTELRKNAKSAEVSVRGRQEVASAFQKTTPTHRRKSRPVVNLASGSGRPLCCEALGRSVHRCLPRYA